MNKITIIGTGSVGATISYSLAFSGIASEIVMIDINGDKSMGEALDIRQGTPFCSPCNIYAGSYYDAKDSDIVVITSGVARKPGQTRLDLAQINLNIMKSIAGEITKYAPDAVYVIVSNPVDILTYAFCKYTDIPESRVIGSGTVLDSARFSTRIADYYRVNQKDVHAYVLGEHGESMVLPWSLANVAGISVEDYSSAMCAQGIYPELKKEDVEQYVRKSGAKVISRKGATFYAVSMSVYHICNCILRGIDTHLTVSTLLHGEYGIDDVCLSLLNIVGKNGAQSKVILPLQEDELAALRKSADSLKAIMGELTF